MRKTGLSLLVGAAIGFPATIATAAGGQSAAPTADEYVCALTGDCGEEEPNAATPAQTERTPRVNATRGFSLSRPQPERRPARQTPQPRQRQTATRPVQRVTPPAAQQPGRADLQLQFASGSSTLTAVEQSKLRIFAEALQRPQLANSRVRIEGHTDSVGGRAMNLELSRRRAQAAADFLVSLGIPAGRLEVRGFGYDRPLPGHRASSPSNRRVEAVRIS